MAAKRKSVSAQAGEKVSEILEAAERKAEEIEGEARERAGEAMQEAAAAIAKLADDLRERAAGLGAEVPAGPTIVPEPTPPQEPEPGPVPVPEPTPDPVPEPTPDPVPEPIPEPPSEPDQPAASNGSSDDAGARLVAMKMALDGSSRKQVEKHLVENYELGDPSELLDDVFERAGK